MPSATSSRWCPTPEQLMILEEMYRGGTRTPNASQIQHITAHLSLYGKIEGKNVFYWFQNHKARDRQKLRRKLMSKQLHLQQEQLQNPNHQFPHPHLLLHQYESPPLALPQFSYYAPLRFLPQDGIKDASTQVISYPMKVDPLPEGCKSMARTYGGDWMITLDVGATAPTCCNRPLKTLELFPLNTTGLKEECTTSKLNPSTPIT